MAVYSLTGNASSPFQAEPTHGEFESWLGAHFLGAIRIILFAAKAS
jgi:hypothetical protein